MRAILPLLLTITAFAGAPAMAAQTPVHVQIFVEPTIGGPAAVLPVQYLAHRLPGKVRLDIRFGAEPAPDALAPVMTFLYVQNQYPDRLFDYLLCNQHDPLNLTCPILLGLDMSGFNPGDPALKAQLQTHVAEARKLEVSAPFPAVYVNGQPYDQTLYLAQFVPYLNSQLPKKDRIAGIGTYEKLYPPIRIYAIGARDGVGVRDRQWERQLRRQIAGIEIVAMNAGSPEARRIVKKAGIHTLPAYVFDREIRKHSNILTGLEKNGIALTRAGGYVALNSQETESRLLLDRNQQPGELTLFVMSHCPFGVKAENAILASLNQNKLPSDFRLRVRFIVNKGDQGFQSLHGQDELDENVRQLIIQKHFPDRFLRYLEIRNRDYQSSNWQTAAREAGIDPESVTARWAEGTRLLEQDYRETQTLGVGASPTFLWANQYLLAASSGVLKNYLGVDPYEVAASLEQQAAPQGSRQ